MEIENSVNASKDLKIELASLEYNHNERFAFLAGFIKNKATFSLVGLGKGQITLKTEISNVAKICLNILKKDLKLEDTRIIFENRTKFKKKIVYTIVSKGNILPLLKEMEFKEDLSDMLPIKMLDKKHIKPYLAGLFCASGSLSNPNKYYHLEISFDNSDLCELIKDKLNNLHIDFKDVNKYTFNTIERRNKFVLYMKNSENISNFLSFLGAINSMYAVENARIENDYINSDNRLNQCIMYNYQRCLKASTQIVEKLEKIVNTEIFNELDDKTKAIIHCRLENKESSYKELVEILHEQGIETSKTGVFNTLKKVEKLI